MLKEKAAPMKTVTLDELPDAINEILEEYEDDSIRSMHVATQAIAEAGAKAINSSAAGAVKGKRYKRSWTFQSQNTRMDAAATLYSRIPGLPHLLEHGHAGSGGGRKGAGAHVHIAPVVEKINKEFEKEIEISWQ